MTVVTRQGGFVTSRYPGSRTPLLVCIVLAAAGNDADELWRQCECLVTTLVARLGELNPPAAEPAVRICLLPVVASRLPSERRPSLLSKPDVGSFIALAPAGVLAEAYEQAWEKLDRHAREYEGRRVPAPVVVSFVGQEIRPAVDERLRRSVDRIRNLQYPAVQGRGRAGKKMPIECPAVVPWLFAFAPDGEVPADLCRLFAGEGLDGAGRPWHYCRWLQHPDELGERCVKLIAALCADSGKQSAALANIFPQPPRISAD